MLVFVGLIIVSFVFYFYYKTKQFRATLPIRKKWYAAVASFSLGSFIFFFGVNVLFVNQSAVTYIVSAIFIILGIAMMITNYKAAKHYHKFVAEETRLNQ
ncbi:YtpI family protein [Planococcus shenhongbingii]|uniref:YtpI family protein n=1 Tax=Planococcus TaxID=1372 RepID=UPI00262CFEE8|nr:YtpI family protein [Planococcus sp. N016]WKA59891.1 YtpI family protein [Planococcus sp. N016]